MEITEVSGKPLKREMLDQDVSFTILKKYGSLKISSFNTYHSIQSNGQGLQSQVNKGW